MIETVQAVPVQGAQKSGDSPPPTDAKLFSGHLQQAVVQQKTAVDPTPQQAADAQAKAQIDDLHSKGQSYQQIFFGAVMVTQDTQIVPEFRRTVVRFTASLAPIRSRCRKA